MLGAVGRSPLSAAHLHLKQFERRPAGAPTPDGRVIDGTWSRVRSDIVLAPAGV